MIDLVQEFSDRRVIEESLDLQQLLDGVGVGIFESYGDAVLDGLFAFVDLVGGLEVQRVPALRTVPGLTTERSPTLVAFLQRGTSDGDLFLGGRAVVLPDATHHLLVRGRVVALEDVGVGLDADHEPDSVVRDSFIAHARDGSVPEVVGLDLVRRDVSPSSDLLQLVVDLGARQRVALLPSDLATVFVRPPARLGRTEQRGVVLVLERMVVQPVRNVRACPEDGPRSRGALEPLRVGVETDSGLTLVQFDISDADGECGCNTLPGDAEKGDDSGVARVLARVKEIVHFVAGENLVGADGRAFGLADDDIATPVTAEFVTEEESSCLAVLTDSAVPETVGGNIGMAAIGHVGEERQDVALVHVDKAFVGTVAHQADVLQAVDERCVGDVHGVQPAEDGLTVFVDVHVLDEFDLRPEASAEIVHVINVVWHRNETSKNVGSNEGIVRTSSSNTEETTANSPAKPDTNRVETDDIFSPSATPKSIAASGGVAA